MSKILSLGKTQYLGDTSDLRFADGVIFSAVSAKSFEIGQDAPHFHENPIVNFILEGESVEKINRETKLRIAGDIKFYRAGDLHQVEIKDFPSRLLSFEFERRFLSENDLSEDEINFAVRTNPFAKHSFLKIYKEFSENDRLSVSSMQILLFDLIAESETRLIKSKPRWINKLDELLNDRWNETLSLRQLSLVLNVHPVTISKYFAKYFACTYGEFMRRLRVEKSLSLIKNSRLSLTEIAFQCGFADQSHFTRNFKKLTGFMPKDFRKL